eukprot:UN28915
MLTDRTNTLLDNINSTINEGSSIDYRYTFNSVHSVNPLGQIRERPSSTLINYRTSVGYSSFRESRISSITKTSDDELGPIPNRRVSAEREPSVDRPRTNTGGQLTVTFEDRESRKRVSRTTSKKRGISPVKKDDRVQNNLLTVKDAHKQDEEVSIIDDEVTVDESVGSDADHTTSSIDSKDTTPFIEACAKLCTFLWLDNDGGLDIIKEKFRVCHVVLVLIVVSARKHEKENKDNKDNHKGQFLMDNVAEYFTLPNGVEDLEFVQKMNETIEAGLLKEHQKKFITDVPSLDPLTPTTCRYEKTNSFDKMFQESNEKEKNNKTDHIIRPTIRDYRNSQSEKTTKGLKRVFSDSNIHKCLIEDPEEMQRFFPTPRNEKLKIAPKRALSDSSIFQKT